MINASLGTAARAAAAGGGGGPCFTLLSSLNRRLATGFPSDAVDARSHEKPRNSERMAPAPCQEPEVVVVAALACPPPPPPLRDQEPVKNKRGCDFHGEIIWASKKQRSSIAAAREHGNAVAEVKAAAAAATSSPIAQAKRAAAPAIAATPSPIAQAKRTAAPTIAATPSPVVQESKGKSPWGSIGVALDEKEEEKLRPCMFAAPVRGLDGLHRDSEVTVLGIALPSRRVKRPVDRDHRHSAEEECYLIKRSRSCPSTMAVCEGSNRVMPTEIQEPTSRSNPVQEAKAAGQHRRKSANSSGHCTTPPVRPFMSLSYGLQSLGVTDVTRVLAKTLTATDCRLDQSRVQFSTRQIMDSPLFNILTRDEHMSVHQLDGQDGLEVEAIDRHGYSYNMMFRYVYSARQYRLMQAWVPFLIQNGVRQGDLVEVGAFRVNGKPVLTLLNYATEGWIPEEIEAAKGLLMLSDCNNGTKS